VSTKARSRQHPLTGVGKTAVMVSAIISPEITHVLFSISLLMQTRRAEHRWIRDTRFLGARAVSDLLLQSKNHIEKERFHFWRTGC
jgi:hypothetical protein